MSESYEQAPVIEGSGDSYVLKASTKVNQPLKEVFDFFSNAENLEFLTPEFLNFRIITKLPIEMKEGQLIDYKISLHGIPIKWRTLISEWKPQEYFSDKQLKGPYLLWEHRHNFQAVDGGSSTVASDIVHYRVPGGRVFGAILNRYFIKPELVRIFTHRKTQLHASFSK